ncbi:hypothetical protein FRX31_022101 [Thalictrum thalictroides]|uniref:Uncharacterized protein n=1 Tax=Thalictrum thalictroides TaxID=46969 RepID=A0A7J6VVX0_THATH|nr:hypothetical protein FRX31_022101 [Thalictrum thalictroides]
MFNKSFKVQTAAHVTTKSVTACEEKKRGSEEEASSVSRHSNKSRRRTTEGGFTEKRRFQDLGFQIVPLFMLEFIQTNYH